MVDKNIQDKLEAYLSSLLRVNEKLNLTRIRDIQEARLLHIEDSLSGLEEMNFAPDGLYVDLGSGGGFPGVPLGLATGRTTMLVDSVKKKMSAIQSILEELSIDQQIKTKACRLEELALEEPYHYSVATARALSQLSVLLELASPLLTQEGVLICFKGQNSNDELKHALEIQELVGMKLISDRSFTLSDKETKRRIICFKKIADSQIRLPRRVGLAQKKPL